MNNIWEAVSFVMSQVGYVQKGKGKASGLNYTYASERDLIAAIRPSLVEAGIVMHCIHAAVDVDTFTTTKGTVMNRTMGYFTFRFTHAASETYLDAIALGEGSDVGDKSANKAMTGAYKYALRQTFVIETGDDPDQFSSEDQQRHMPIEQEVRQAAPKGNPPGMRGDGITPAKHWTQGSLQSFWIEAKKLGLTNDDVHVALAVASVKDYTGSKQDAWAILNARAAELAKDALFPESEGLE